MKLTHSLLMSLLLLACSSSPEPVTQTAEDQQLRGGEPPTTDTEPGPVVIVEPPEPVQTEPLATEVDETAEPTREPVRRPEPDSEWCPGCPHLCLDFVAMLEACRNKLTAASSVNHGSDDQEHEAALQERQHAGRTKGSRAHLPEGPGTPAPAVALPLMSISRNIHPAQVDILT